MKLIRYDPSTQLRPYIKQYVVAEKDGAEQYKVLAATGLVMGFQYKGQLSRVNNLVATPLSTAGITGLTDSFQVFKNSEQTGTVLVYFKETGFTHFSTTPANQIFNLSLPLTDIFDKYLVAQVEAQLSIASSDFERIIIIEQFLVSQLLDIKCDLLIDQAVKLILQSEGTIRIKALSQQLFISQSPFEKRFRKQVGTTAKKFCSIVRFNAVLRQINQTSSLTDLCYQNNYFDQAHFIKDFKQFTGETPENFKRCQ